jgi:nitrite reductase/ring-hydroxylating ferredoxin subunit
VSQTVYLCRSEELINSGSAVPFDVQYFSQSCAAFAVRYAGRVYAYLNRCSSCADGDGLPAESVL